MKKLTVLLISFLFAGSLFAQVPQAINYQAVARNQQGNVLANKSISVQVTILDNNNEVYRETHQAVTNQFGLFTLQVGKGTVKAGVFQTIAWGSGNKMIKVGLDPNGGTSYLDMGTSPILTVPFAMVAETALNVSNQRLSNLKDVDTTGASSGYVLGFDGAKWKPTLGPSQQGWQITNGDLSNVNTTGKIGIGVAVPKAKLHIEGNDKENIMAFKGNKFMSNRLNGNDYGIPTSGQGLYLSQEVGSYKQVYYFTEGNVLDTSPVFGIVTETGIGAWRPAFNISQQGMLGLGVYKPKAKFHMQDGGFLAYGENGSVDFKGTGTCMMWIPEKRAFRAGFSGFGKAWDRDSIGDFSFASGYGTKALGTYSTALGITSNASGSASTAIGLGAFAMGKYSTSIGSQSQALGDGSMALGNQTQSLSLYEVSLGISNISGGNATSWLATDPLFTIGNGYPNGRSNALQVLKNGNTTIYGNLTVRDTLKGNIDLSGKALLLDGDIGNTNLIGNGTRFMWIPAKGAFRAGYAFYNSWNKDSIGQYSVATGYWTLAKGRASVASGQITQATGDYATAMGYSVLASGTSSFAIGDQAQASGTTSVAMGYKTNAIGNLSSAMGNATTSSGVYAFASGSGSAASGISSTAMGNTTIASGGASTALGNTTIASGENSIAMGENSKASGKVAFASGFGTSASGQWSSANGYGATATGNISTVFGYGTKSKHYSGFVAGTFNDTANAANPLLFNGLNRIFQIGNGTADNVRRNALTILQNGNTGVGLTDPQNALSVNNGMNIDQGESNQGTIDNGLKFGSNSGEGIASKRTSGPTRYGLDFYTNSVNRMSISNAGNIGIANAAPIQTLDINGRMHLSNGVIQRGGQAITNISDLGLYSRVSGNYIRLVTNAAPIRFYSDDGAGTTSNFTVEANGNVGIGAITPDAKLAVDGYTKLGIDAPKIKMKKLTGTTAAGYGGSTGISHGLNKSKILAVSVLVEDIFSTLVPPSSGDIQGIEFYTVTVSSTEVKIYNGSPVIASLPAPSAIANSPVRILITYEE